MSQTIYLTKATRSEVAEELSLLSPTYHFAWLQETGKKNFISEGFKLCKLGRVINIVYKKDGLKLQDLEEAIKEAFADKDVPERFAKKEAMELLERHDLRELAKQHLTSAALKRQDDFKLIRVAEYLHSVHSPLTVENDKIIETFLASCLYEKKQKTKKASYHKDSFKKDVIRLIQKFQKDAFVEELQLEYPEVFEGLDRPIVA